jgi:hypothetical protein
MKDYYSYPKTSPAGKQFAVAAYEAGVDKCERRKNSKREKCLKMSRAAKRQSHTSSRKKQGRNGSTLQMADKKPYISIGESNWLPWCTVVADHDDPSTGGALSDPD